ERFHAEAAELVAKLKQFRYEGERRLALIAEYATSPECRSVFLRRYFGEDNPPRCGRCDRCRAAAAAHPSEARGAARGDRGRSQGRRATASVAASGPEARRNGR